MLKFLRIIGLISFVMFIFSVIVFAEDITITTYYPSPYGVYDALQTDKLGVGDSDGSGSLTSADVPTTAGDAWIKRILTTGNNIVNVSDPKSADIVIGSNTGIRHDSSIMWWSASSASRISNTADVFYGSTWNTTSPNFALAAAVGGSSYFQGNLGIGVSNPTYKIQVNGQPAANGYTAWTNYSDRRLKENISDVENGVINKIMKLRPASFNYNDKYYQLTGYSKEEYKLLGFIAQEIKEVFPEMVQERQLGKDLYLDTNLTNLQIYLVKAIQEQQSMIKAQQLQIDELKARLYKLEKK